MIYQSDVYADWKPVICKRCVSAVTALFYLNHCIIFIDFYGYINQWGLVIDDYKNTIGTFTHIVLKYKHIAVALFRTGSILSTFLPGAAVCLPFLP